MGIWFCNFMCLRANEWKLKIKRIRRDGWEVRVARHPTWLRKACTAHSAIFHSFPYYFQNETYEKIWIEKKMEKFACAWVNETFIFLFHIFVSGFASIQCCEHFSFSRFRNDVFRRFVLQTSVILFLMFRSSRYARRLMLVERTRNDALNISCDLVAYRQLIFTSSHTQYALT